MYMRENTITAAKLFPLGTCRYGQVVVSLRRLLKLLHHQLEFVFRD